MTVYNVSLRITCRITRSIPFVDTEAKFTMFLSFTASGERMHSRPAWSPDAKRPRTEPKTKKEKESLCLPVIHTPPQEKFKVGTNDRSIQTESPIPECPVREVKKL